MYKNIFLNKNVYNFGIKHNIRINTIASKIYNKIKIILLVYIRCNNITFYTVYFNYITSFP